MPRTMSYKEDFQNSVHLYTRHPRTFSKTPHRKTHNNTIPNIVQHETQNICQNESFHQNTSYVSLLSHKTSFPTFLTPLVSHYAPKNHTANERATYHKRNPENASTCMKRDARTNEQLQSNPQHKRTVPNRFQACHRKRQSKSCFPLSSVQVLGPSWEAWNQVGTKIRKKRTPKNHQKIMKKGHATHATRRCSGPFKYSKPKLPTDRRTH